MGGRDERNLSFLRRERSFLWLSSARHLAVAGHVCRMKWELSTFGKNLCEGSGIGELMDDLGEALAGGGDVKMLGGGQPAHVPEVDAVWRRRMEEIMAELSSGFGCSF